MARAAKAASVPAKPNAHVVNNLLSTAPVGKLPLRIPSPALVAHAVLVKQENAHATVLKPRTPPPTEVFALAALALLRLAPVRRPRTAASTRMRSISLLNDKFILIC